MPVIFKEFISFYTLLFSIINVATVISCVFDCFMPIVRTNKDAVFALCFVSARLSDVFALL